MRFVSGLGTEITQMAEIISKLYAAEPQIVKMPEKEFKYFMDVGDAISTRSMDVVKVGLE